MNKNFELQQKIDDYLFDMLSEEDRAAFEQMMQDDDALRKEVELVRQITEGFRVKGEQEARTEMQNVSSAEMRNILTAAEQKYPQPPTPTTPPQQRNNRFVWGLVAGIAASVLLILAINYFNNRHPDQKQWEKLYSETIRENHVLTSRNTTLHDSLITQKKINGIQHATIDSLKKIKTTIAPTTSDPFQADLLAMLIIHDKQKKGIGQSLTFTTQNQTNCNPESFRIEWTPVNKQGDIYVYQYNEYKEKAPVSKYESVNYNLGKGSYTLQGLENNSLYFFEIKTDNMTYKFPFITK